MVTGNQRQTKVCTPSDVIGVTLVTGIPEEHTANMNPVTKVTGYYSSQFGGGPAEYTATVVTLKSVAPLI